MKPKKVVIFIVTLLIINFYAWYCFARVIDGFADEAAALVVVDTLSVNSANDIKRLREIKSLMQGGRLDEASSLIDDAIDLKLYILENCLTEKCREYNKKLDQ